MARFCGIINRGILKSRIVIADSTLCVESCHLWSYANLWNCVESLQLPSLRSILKKCCGNLWNQFYKVAGFYRFYGIAGIFCGFCEIIRIFQRFCVFLKYLSILWIASVASLPRKDGKRKWRIALFRHCGLFYCPRTKDSIMPTLNFP